jgi:hypothetical protein
MESSELEKTEVTTLVQSGPLSSNATRFLWRGALKGQSHEKVGEIRVWNISLGPK